MFQNRTGNWQYAPTPEDSIKACADIEHQIRDWGYPDALALKLNLIVEELFLNTLKYGTQDSDHLKIGISLQEDREKHILLTYQDTGPEFNPLDQDVDPDPENQIGGRGLFLIKGMSQAAQFIREDGWNRLILEFTAD